MNDNLTIKGASFQLVYKDKLGSLRRAPSGTPFSTGAAGSVSIAHTIYNDSQTKKPGRRSVFRVQIDKAAADGSNTIAYAQLIVGRPTDAVTVPDSDITALVDCVRQFVSPTTADASALNLAGEFATQALQ